MSEQQFIHGILWYEDEEAYFRFRDACDDKDHFYSSFAEWGRSTKQTEDELARAGHVFTKINADVDEFIAWCHLNRHKPNFKARLAFTSRKAAEIHGYGKLEA